MAKKFNRILRLSLKLELSLTFSRYFCYGVFTKVLFWINQKALDKIKDDADTQDQ